MVRGVEKGKRTYANRRKNCLAEPVVQIKKSIIHSLSISELESVIVVRYAAHITFKYLPDN